MTNVIERMTTRDRRAARPRRGFTLIELLIVIAILGILSTIVIALFRSSTEDVRRTTFITSGRTFTRAAMRYWLENGEPLEDGSSGVVPAGFEAYVQESRWGETPIGGVWDTERDSFGVVAALGVHFNGEGETHDDAYMTELDEAVDDGDLSTGEFRKIAADRYYFVLAE